MKKNLVSILLCIIVFLLIIIGVLVYKNFDNSKKLDEVTISEKDYYKSMHKRMYDYYKVMYKGIIVSEDKKNSTIRLNLGALERQGFPMDEFVSYDGKEECDRSKSYALRKVINNEYVIEVYYKCGNTANYDYTEAISKTKVSDNNER